MSFCFLLASRLANAHIIVWHAKKCSPPHTHVQSLNLVGFGGPSPHAEQTFFAPLSQKTNPQRWQNVTGNDTFNFCNYLCSVVFFVRLLHAATIKPRARVSLDCRCCRVWCTFQTLPHFRSQRAHTETGMKGWSTPSYPGLSFPHTRVLLGLDVHSMG